MAKCNNCNNSLNLHLPTEKERKTPLAGDYTVCGHCGEIGKFDDNMNIVTVNAKELLELHKTNNKLFLVLEEASETIKKKFVLLVL